MSFVALRYFNACGAHPNGKIGELHNPETHLIPLILQVPLGIRESIYVFGDDYDTHDGTGVRDYIHVVDLAKGHVKAIEHYANPGVHICNLGTGTGYSVLDLVKAFERVNNVKVKYVIKDRRPGDIATCYANPARAKEELDWVATKGIDEMCRDTWNYALKHK